MGLYSQFPLARMSTIQFNTFSGCFLNSNISPPFVKPFSQFQGQIISVSIVLYENIECVIS